MDQEHNIFSYSLDEHFLLKKLSPKTNFAGLNKKIETLALIANENEDVVYFITPEKYYMFTVESLGLEMYVNIDIELKGRSCLEMSKMFRRRLFISNTWCFYLQNQVYLYIRSTKIQKS